MTSLIILSILFFILMLSLLLSLSIKLSKLTLTLPPNEPMRWLEQYGQPQDKPPRKSPIVVCAGDSITHGIISTNWVAMLESQFPEARFINAGVNSELAYNLYSRLDPIIKINPDAIIILIGTNDANATFGVRSTMNYFTMQKLPEFPTPWFYKEILTLIVQRLKNETDAKTALTSLPPIGEDPLHYSWIRIKEYVEIIKTVVEAEHTAYIPLYETMTDYIRRAPKKQCIPFESIGKAVKQALWQHHMMGKTWDEISAQFGYHLLIDGLHFNSTGGMIMADLAKQFLVSALGENPGTPSKQERRSLI
ncbi:MAG TPA: GDSL-type esterase/lipase family protein [Spirochaetales bacterium]|nr:GDSL-type esterase/lipase family protein [Spirochaetales bacterium]